MAKFARHSQSLNIIFAVVVKVAGLGRARRGHGSTHADRTWHRGDMTSLPIVSLSAGYRMRFVREGGWDGGWVGGREREGEGGRGTDGDTSSVDAGGFAGLQVWAHRCPDDDVLCHGAPKRSTTYHLQYTAHGALCGVRRVTDATCHAAHRRLYDTSRTLCRCALRAPYYLLQQINLEQLAHRLEVQLPQGMLHASVDVSDYSGILSSSL